jgi:hypothetical protein
MTESSQRKSH